MQKWRLIYQNNFLCTVYLLLTKIQGFCVKNLNKVDTINFLLALCLHKVLNHFLDYEDLKTNISVHH